MSQQNLKLNILDYSPVDEGLMPSDALASTIRLAQLAEQKGAYRYWVSEHHGMPAAASNSPEILMSHIAAATKDIRVGSGAVLLPNYSSLKIAENYQLLESMFPNRVDLGVGRSPGADSRIGEALNDEKGKAIPYTKKVSDLIGFITGDHHEKSYYRGIKAHPETSTTLQPFILGASGSTAEIAAQLGLGFTFAHFINPTGDGAQAAEAYRRAFQATHFSSAPSVIVCVFVAIADTEAEASRYADAFHLWLAYAESANPFSRVPSLSTTEKHVWSPNEEAVRRRNAGRLISGTPQQVADQLRSLAELYGTNEVMVNLMMPGEQARFNALEGLSQALS